MMKPTLAILALLLGAITVHAQFTNGVQVTDVRFVVSCESSNGPKPVSKEESAKQDRLQRLREELSKRILSDEELSLLMEAGWEKLYSLGAWYASGGPGYEEQQKFLTNLQIQFALRSLANTSTQLSSISELRK